MFREEVKPCSRYKVGGVEKPKCCTTLELNYRIHAFLSGTFFYDAGVNDVNFGRNCVTRHVERH